MRSTALSRALIDPTSKYYFIVSDFLAVITLVSVTAIVLETVPRFDSYHNIFTWIEWVAVAIFTLEYCLRLWVTTPKRAYAFSFYGVIDLLAIVPSFIGVGNFTFLKTARAIRLIRLLRLLRLAKLSALNKRQDPDEQLNFVILNVVLLVAVLGIATLLVGVLMYVLEGTSESFMSIPSAMFWSFKVFLVGIPIEYPVTVAGEIGHIVARLIGLIVFGVVVGVTGNIFKEYLFASPKK